MREKRALSTCLRFGALLALATVFAAAGWSAGQDPAGRLAAFEERESLLELFRAQGPDATPRFAEALGDARPLVRRTAAHLLVRVGEPAIAEIEQALRHPDFRIRRIAYRGLEEMGKLADYRELAAADAHPLLAREVDMLLTLDPRPVLMEFPLPRNGWRFRTDPQDAGREEGWHEVGYDDGDWMADAPTETPWGTFLETPYVGAAWYRRTVPMPGLPEERGTVLLEFNGVDEEAWVWLNGEYVGGQAIGPTGWNRPFEVDITEHVKPGQTNHVAIRAENSRGDGGIWRPIHVRVMGK